jgi:pantothenate kinase
VAFCVWGLAELNFTLDNSGFTNEITVPDAEIAAVHRPLLLRFAASARDGRAIVLLAGPPGSGKSVLAALWQRLADQDGLSLVAVSMDGFHFPNRYLAERQLLARKGSPETFDVRSMTIALAQAHAGTPAVWPRYDRNLHEPVADGVRITDQKVVLVEGNYFFLNEPHWAALRRYASLTVRLDVDRACLRERVIERHIRGGMTRDQAQQKYRDSDLHNIVLVAEHGVEADIVLMRTSKGAYKILEGGTRGL